MIKRVILLDQKWKVNLLMKLVLNRFMSFTPPNKYFQLVFTQLATKNKTNFNVDEREFYMQMISSNLIPNNMIMQDIKVNDILNR